MATLHARPNMRPAERTPQHATRKGAQPNMRAAACTPACSAPRPPPPLQCMREADRGRPLRAAVAWAGAGQAAARGGHRGLRRHQQRAGGRPAFRLTCLERLGAGGSGLVMCRGWHPLAGINNLQVAPGQWANMLSEGVGSLGTRDQHQHRVGGRLANGPTGSC